MVAILCKRAGDCRIVPLEQQIVIVEDDVTLIFSFNNVIQRPELKNKNKCKSLKGESILR
jgi:GR25 family glycosyltransferase involved in LPS biosynthesis